MAKYADEIKLHLEQTVTNLQAARELLDTGQYDTAALRAADAAFHSASALLLNEEIDPSKHGDIITLVHQIFVNGRRLTREQGEKISWLFQFRAPEGSHEHLPAIAGEAQKAVEFAESFFAATKVILEA
jgi:uncharacterized protein (UPF0332 family)